MTALAILLRHGRRAHAQARGIPLSRALSTTTAGTDPGALSVADATRRLRREHDPDRAVSILEAIDTASISAASTRHALSLAARRLSRSRRFADAEALLSSHLPASTTEPHLAAVLCSYASANLPEKALDAFRSTATSLPTPFSPLPFNALLSAFLRCRRHHRVPVLFSELSKEFSITLDATSYGILVKAYCMSRDDVKAKQALDQMREQGISPTTSIYTTLIDSMYKQKKTEEAEHLWKEMVESGCKPDVVTYNVKAMNYGLHGKPEEVMEVMMEMEAAGVKPDTITYNFLMTCYCRNGKVEDAKVLYHSLAEKGCSANAATYKHMLAALCAHGDFDAGLGIVKESLKRHKVPDFRTMKGLVEGLAKGGRVAEAKTVVAEVKKRFPENLLSGWMKLEKELGLDSDSIDNSLQSKGTSGETVVESKPVAADAEALEREGSAVEENAVSEESSDDEVPGHEVSSSEEMPRGPA
ncbi:pentatricopeptide repeat-containing protein [Panicum miliaceum]|uniref:Pentatricopeptide repeat-containing protein n=1 Tax=Panicum miliaceum TaxID=4540 RepID=A0A3L6QIF0_PANMI|nr:pentatricopeptide repeat-containing protein [Panicum miliaceum]